MASIFSKWHLFQQEDEPVPLPPKTYYEDDVVKDLMSNYEYISQIGFKFYKGKGHVVADINVVLTQKQFEELMLNRKPIE